MIAISDTFRANLEHPSVIKRSLKRLSWNFFSIHGNFFPCTKKKIHGFPDLTPKHVRILPGCSELVPMGHPFTGGGRVKGRVQSVRGKGKFRVTIASGWVWSWLAIKGFVSGTEF